MRVLEISGCIVTTGALGYQTGVAAETIRKRPDYVLAVKGNQNYLFEDVVGQFDWALGDKFKQAICTRDGTASGGHGRVEARRRYVTGDIDWLRKKADWKGVSSVAMVESERGVAGAEQSREGRYYISSLEADAEHLNRVIRGHWSIENSLHWVLDVAFREGNKRIRNGQGPENMAMLRHIALNLLKQDKSIKLGIKSKRKNVSRDERYLLKVLSR